MTLTLLPYDLVICRLTSTDELPIRTNESRFFSLTRTIDELSLVIETHFVPVGTQANAGWRALKLHGPIDFSETGIIHALTAPAAQERIGVFAISTFDTDYLLTKNEDLSRLVAAMREAGFTVVE